MLFSIEQAFVGRDEKRTPLKTPAWEAIPPCTLIDLFYIQITFGTLVVIPGVVFLCPRNCCSQFTLKTNQGEICWVLRPGQEHLD